MPNKFNYRAISATLLLLVSLSEPAASAPSVTLCAERPWLSAIMIEQLKKNTGIAITVQTAPWLRCIYALQNGQADGAFKASFKADRLNYSVYPMANGKLDVDRRMATESYHLYRLKGSRLGWDGKSLNNLDGKIGAQAGFSIVEFLTSLGAQVDSGAHSAETNLRMLLRGRFAAVALQTQEGDSLLNGEFSEIERVEPALVEKPYFLVFSRRFFAEHADLANELWNGVAKVRESPEYMKAMHDNK